MKPDIKGAAALMQGYVAREGFGITLKRNQIVEMIPNEIKIIFPLSFLMSNIFLKISYTKRLYQKSMFTPPPPPLGGLGVKPVF